MLKDTAAAVGALCVDPAAVGGHDAGQWLWDRWVEPVLPASPTTPVHPNAAGQAAVAAMARNAPGRQLSSCTTGVVAPADRGACHSAVGRGRSCRPA
ncbi:hypothetical protein [Yinghuangia seranimata]|uniref:hypothetical protein n=1 Tax=Yinghuangia seranimata TaxID=408067 RepID=UPI00248C0A29|nr:hypothetical protein [Yinghuangia seranimata]MDI2130015.1 hypothetical protein [Yinghuangia seranimata]